MNSYLFEECERRKNGIITVPKRNKFCSFICGGEYKTTWRKEIVKKLSQYKRVDCGGRFLNNIGYTVPVGTSCSGKIEHNLNYKFAIAFENEDHPGYVTEKICDVYKSNCIPIYAGNRAVVDDFNPNTFINANDFKNLDEMIEYIIKVDNDDELYASYFKEPMFSNKWLDIFNDPYNTFYKNITDCIVGKYTDLFNRYHYNGLTILKKQNINEIKEKYESECNRISDINEHLPVLYEYAKECESILECGVRGCVSSWAFSYGLLNNNKTNKKILLNDIESCDIKEFLNLTKNTDLIVDYKWCSDLELIINENVDMTFIDTFHVYGQLRKELNKFSKVTNKYIVMHDTTVDEVWGEAIHCDWNIDELSIKTGLLSGEISKGLGPAISEFLYENREWVIYKKYTNNNGLTILKKQNINENNHKNLQIYNIWHNKLFDNCYEKLDEYSLEKLIMYDVNPTYTKVYNKDKKYNILKEYELTNYESLYQDTNYCQTSCFYHVYTNKLYEKSDYVGFIQYDMILESNFIYAIEEKINNSQNDIYFYSLLDNNKLNVKFVCNPYDKSILQKYNEYFNTNHSYDTIKKNKKSSNFISLHTFVIPKKTYIKLMSWFVSIKDWLHSNYLDKLYDTSIAEITEEIFGLFLLLQMIEDESIALEELKLNHEWPRLHNETEWLNYKVVMPENVNKISNQSNNKPKKLVFDIGANIGNWALANISEENKIISVEASTGTFNKLVNNVSSYGNIVPLNYAVCDSKEEHITFYEAESDVLSSLNKEWIYGSESRFNCNYKATLSKTITLDKLIEQYGVPEVIKIDVESAEYSCIKSLTKKVNNLCFEWASENQDMILNSLNYLFKLGFREFYIQMNNDDYKFVPDNYYSLNHTKQILLSTIPKREWGMIHCR